MVSSCSAFHRHIMRRLTWEFERCNEWISQALKLGFLVLCFFDEYLIDSFVHNNVCVCVFTSFIALGKIINCVWQGCHVRLWCRVLVWWLLLGHGVMPISNDVYRYNTTITWYLNIELVFISICFLVLLCWHDKNMNVFISPRVWILPMIMYD